MEIAPLMRISIGWVGRQSFDHGWHGLAWKNSRIPAGFVLLVMLGRDVRPFGFGQLKNRHSKRGGRGVRGGNQAGSLLLRALCVLRVNKGSGFHPRLFLSSAAGNPVSPQNFRCLTVTPLLMGCFRESKPMRRRMGMGHWEWAWSWTGWLRHPPRRSTGASNICCGRFAEAARGRACNSDNHPGLGTGGAWSCRRAAWRCRSLRKGRA